MKRLLPAILAGILACAGCSGGGGSASAPPPASAADFLTVEDVRRALGQAIAEATARGAPAHIAIVDRVGNVLAIHPMAGAPSTVLIASGLAADGLETPVPVVPASLAAIAKAVTGAYLSSGGNAFSTRTASQIIQEHFNPQEAGQPSGPLYGVQFSQLSCSDVNRNLTHGDVGPKRSPLGLAGDPGGIPLYKNGVLVGGIGIESDGLYRIDRVMTDVDEDPEERIAVAGASGFAAPGDIRGERITADGRSFRYLDGEGLSSNPSAAAPFTSTFLEAGYSTAPLRAGVAFGTPASGIRPDAQAFAARGGWILVDAANQNRYPPRAGSDGGLAAAEVQAILEEALALANRMRAQIRRPLGASAQVTIAVVDTAGDILGLVRTPDAPVFGIDVSVQKSRTAMFFSHPAAGAELLAAPDTIFIGSGRVSSVSMYATRFTGFVGEPLDGRRAWTPRAIGNLHRPFYPDGLDGAPPGPLSTPIATWSPFNVGFQLDLVNNQLLRSIAFGSLETGCAGRPVFNQPPVPGETQIAKLRNGAQIFPGGVPIYRGSVLVGGIGVSGDGVDQDDMIAAFGLANAAGRLGTGLGNAPAAMRADRLTPLGTRLRYVQCPQAPFNDSSEQNVCAGL